LRSDQLLELFLAPPLAVLRPRLAELLRPRAAVLRPRLVDVVRPRLVDVVRPRPPRLVVLRVVPRVAARWTFARSLASVRLMLRKFFRESLRVRSMSRITSRPPRPSSFWRSLRAPSAASSDFSSRDSDRGDRRLPLEVARELRAREVRVARPREVFVVLWVRRDPLLRGCGMEILRSLGYRSRASLPPAVRPCRLGWVA
jgi:hypothetical protein